jgi:hypothetical protein
MLSKQGGMAGRWLGCEKKREREKVEWENRDDDLHVTAVVRGEVLVTRTERIE